MAAGGMVSNHRLVLFTHALCRLSYPAVGGKTNGPDTSGLCKIAHFQKMDLAARWDAEAGRSGGAIDYVSRRNTLFCAPGDNRKR